MLDSSWVSLGSMGGTMMAVKDEKVIEGVVVSDEYMQADGDFLEALREYRLISNQEKVLKAKKDLVKDKIARTMGPKFYAVDEDGLVVCTYKEDNPRIKFDEGAFEHDYPQLYLKYLVEDKKIIRSLRPKI